MKSITGVAVAALLMLMVLAGTSTAGEGGELAPRAAQVSVPCYRLRSETVRYIKRPDRCDFGLQPGCPVPVTYCVDPFKDIKWKSYGGRKAKAKGRPFVTGPGWVDPIKFKLTKIRDPKCGPPIYTKVTYEDGGSQRLLRCDKNG